MQVLPVEEKVDSSKINSRPSTISTTDPTEQQHRDIALRGTEDAARQKQQI
jgi:hypothetical protein